MNRRKASEISIVELVRMIAKLRGVLYEARLASFMYSHQELVDVELNPRDVLRVLEETTFDNDIDRLGRFTCVRACRHCGVLVTGDSTACLYSADKENGESQAWRQLRESNEARGRRLTQLENLLQKHGIHWRKELFWAGIENDFSRRV